MGTQTLHRLVLTLDALCTLDEPALAELYAAGRVPSSLAVLNGSPRGRLVALRGLQRTPLAPLVHALAGARFFPWQGKDFSTRGRKSGKGANRLSLPLLRPFTLFSFQSRIAASALDGADCIRLDYDHAGNPWPLRRIRDELREVAPGLYFGPAFWRPRHGAPVLLLWFALDAREAR